MYWFSSYVLYQLELHSDPYNVLQLNFFWQKSLTTNIYVYWEHVVHDLNHISNDKLDQSHLQFANNNNEKFHCRHECGVCKTINTTEQKVGTISLPPALHNAAKCFVQATIVGISKQMNRWRRPKAKVWMLTFCNAIKKTGRENNKDEKKNTNQVKKNVININLRNGWKRDMLIVFNFQLVSKRRIDVVFGLCCYLFLFCSFIRSSSSSSSIAFCFHSPTPYLIKD